MSGEKAADEPTSACDNDKAHWAVRPLRAFELAALAELHAACFEDAWDQSALAALLAMPGAFALLAEPGAGESGGAVPGGFVMVRAIAGEAEILSLGVRPAERRRGLGRRLLAAALAEAAAHGAAKLFLEVAIDNLPARALYLAGGFAQVGRRANYYSRPGEAGTALVLAKAIRRVAK
jgi:ribosomal-protein-alanine N-acetyltransferase